MTVEIWFRDSLETEVIGGDLLNLTHGLNTAAAQGKSFTIFEDRSGNGLMVQTQNIIKARELEDVDAYIGGR